MRDRIAGRRKALAGFGLPESRQFLANQNASTALEPRVLHMPQPFMRCHQASLGAALPILPRRPWPPHYELARPADTGPPRHHPDRRRGGMRSARGRIGVSCSVWATRVVGPTSAHPILTPDSCPKEQTHYHARMRTPGPADRARFLSTVRDQITIVECARTRDERNSPDAEVGALLLGYVKFISLMLALGAFGIVWRAMAHNSPVSMMIWAIAALALIGLAATPTLMWPAQPWATH